MRSTNTRTTKHNILPRDGRGVRDTKVGGKPSLIPEIRQWLFRLLPHR